MIEVLFFIFLPSLSTPGTLGAIDSIRFFDILSHQVQPPDAENRMSGGVGEVMSAIPSPRPDLLTFKKRVV